jgi:hypothetical protein
MAVLTPSQQARIRQELTEVFVEPGSPLSAFVNDEGFIKAGAPVSAFTNDAGYVLPGAAVSQFTNDAGYITTRLTMHLETTVAAAADTHVLSFTPRGDVLIFLAGAPMAPTLYSVTGDTVTFTPAVTGTLIFYYGSNP